MFVLYKSSAGSGKTFTLVKEYLKICLIQPQHYKAILAITFTNKAAAEMKTRIIASLHNYLLNGSDDVVDLVITETDLSVEKATENAHYLLENILHSYSDFSVMTIDSFISRIVRTFAHDLELPLKFDIELDTEKITNEVVEKLIADARKDNFIGDVLTEFAISKIHATGSWAIDFELKKIGSVTFNEKYVEYVSDISGPDCDDQFWRQLIDDIKQAVFQFQKHVNLLAWKALEIIENHDLVVDNFAYQKSGAAGALMKYANGTVPQDFEISKRLADGHWITKNTPSDIKQKISGALESGLDQTAVEIIDYINKNRRRYISYYLIFKNIYSEALINQFIQLTERYKIEKNIIPLFDFSKKVSDVVKNEPVPFLYWRLGSQYLHIMIDEFQDTSSLQWINLMPLVEESVSNGHFNMAVGDGKQAIYRWRAGDVKIMEEQLPIDLNENLIQNQLSHNYRSRKEIVEFNNTFFSNILERFEGLSHSLFSTLYSENAIKQKSVSDQQGYVQVVTVDTADARKKGEKQEKILEKIYSDIEQIINEKNGYSYQDIAILVRKNIEAEMIAQFLSNKGIGVISPDSLTLRHSSVVRFVISTLRYIVSEDKISLLNMWLFSGRDVTDFETTINKDGGIYEIESSLSGEFAARMHILYQLPVYEAMEEIIGIFHLNDNYHGFLQGLLDTAFNRSEKLSSDIHQFLEWWDDDTETQKATLLSVEQSDAVTISTIHKAKGLEFPVVLIPFEWDLVDRPSVGKSNFIWVRNDQFGGRITSFPFIVDVQKDLEESWFHHEYHEEMAMSCLDNLNLVYVAFTRAIDRLYLYVYGDYGNSDQFPKNTVELIQGQIRDMNMQVSTDGLMSGGPSKKSVVHKDSEVDILDELPNYFWRKKITMKRRAMELWKLEETELKEKIDRGVLVHEILAGIETTADIAHVIEKQYRLGLFSSDEKIELTDIINGLMGIEYSKGHVKDWFKPGLVVKNERTIASQENEYRPDRVVITNNKAVIIDYKTGQKEPGHIVQVNEYESLLQKMGYEDVEKYLLYIDDEEVVEVPWNS